MTNVEDRVERALHVLAERIEPDVTAARARLGSRAGSTGPPARRVLRPQVWVTLAAVTVALVGVGSLWAVGSRPERPTAQTDPALAPPDPSEDSVGNTVPPAPSSSLSVEPPMTAGDPPPDVATPQRVAVLDPRPGVAPIRSDPVLDWVHGTTASAERRWFVRRAPDGTPTGGVSVSHAADSEWVTTFHDGRPAAIAGVDARIVGDPPNVQVGWLTDDGLRVVAGVGDVDVEETIAAARVAASADQLDGIAVPEGFEEVAVPADQGSVRYEDTMVTIGYATVGQAGPVDLATVAFMTRGRDGPISRVLGEEAWLTTTFGGHPTAVVAVGANGIATIVGLPGTDVASLVPDTAVVLAQEVTIANPEATHGIPADATKTHGEIARGRFVVYEHTTTDGYECVSIDASWGGSGDCFPPGKSDCPVADMISGPNEPTRYDVFVPYQVDDLAVLLDDEPAEMTIEHAQGFTFAYGPAPSAGATIEVITNGQPAC